MMDKQASKQLNSNGKGEYMAVSRESEIHEQGGEKNPIHLSLFFSPFTSLF